MTPVGLGETRDTAPSLVNPIEMAQRRSWENLSGYVPDHLIWWDEPHCVVVTFKAFMGMDACDLPPKRPYAGRCWKRSLDGAWRGEVPDADGRWELCWYGNRPEGFNYNRTTGEGIYDLSVMCRRMVIWGVPY